MSRLGFCVLAQLSARQCLLSVVLISATTAVWSQQASSAGTAGSSTASATEAALTATPAEPDKVPRKAWKFTPSVGLNLTRTDNATLTTNGSSDLITRLSPGFRFEGSSGRATGNLDFKLEKISYERTEGRDRIQRAMNGTGTLEVLDRWLYVDVNGRISRQSISAFGQQSAGSDVANNNMVETRTYQVAPYIKGRAGNFADYNVRFDNTDVSSAGTNSTHITVQTIQADLSGATSFSRLDWSLNANNQESKYAAGQKNQTASLRGRLTYAVDPQFKVFLIRGQETNDYLSFTKQTTSINGFGLNWAPTERTRVELSKEKRYFGNGHTFSVDHRMAQTSFRLSDKKDVAVLSPQLLTTSQGTYYDLLNNLLRSSFPDDADRDAQIRNFLQNNGLPADAQILGTTQAPRASLTRSQEAAFVINGALNTITLSAQRSERTSLSPAVTGITDDFSLSSTIRQRGTNVNWAYRLSSLSTLSFLATKSRNEGASGTNLSTRLSSTNVTLSSKLGAYTNGTLGFRRTRSEGLFSYVENAVTAGVMLTF